MSIYMASSSNVTKEKENKMNNLQKRRKPTMFTYFVLFALVLFALGIRCEQRSKSIG